MTTQPTSLELTSPDCLQVVWSDGQVRQYSVQHLRDNCPCATCREKRRAEQSAPTALPILSIAETQPLRITLMQPQGRYAYAIHFSDGHDTGLFTLENLRELGSVIQK